MKRIVKAAFSTACAITLLSSSAMLCSAWKWVSHREITKSSINILKNDKKTSAYNFYKSYSNVLNQYCTVPDNGGDFEKGMGLHYYNVRTSSGDFLDGTKLGGYFKNFALSGGYSRSARTMFEEDYTMALCQYKSGKKDQAIKSLGRAVHMLSDIGCTPHVTESRAIKGSIHEKFELLANEICNTKKNLAKNSYKALYDSYGKNSFEKNINQLAVSAAIGLGSMKNIKKNKSDAKETIIDMLTKTERNVAAMMYNFHKDATQKNNKNNYIVNGGIYYIRNRKSGKCIDVPHSKTSNGTNLIQYDFNGCKNQKFKAVLNNDNTFSFIPMCNTKKILYVDFIGDLELQDKSKKQGTEKTKFRIAHTDSKYFRITTKESDFSSILRVKKPYKDNGANIENFEFNPNSLNHYWYFQKV